MSSTATPEARARSLAATCDASTEIARLASQEMATKKKASTLTLIDANDANEKTSPPRDSSPAEVDARVRALYYVMQSVESRLGGGEGVEGLYGSITRTGTAKVLSSLTRHSGLDRESHLVDVGAGLGRPLLHALADPGVALASGVELDPVKCEKAEAFAAQARAALLLRKGSKTKAKEEEKEEEVREGEEKEEKEEVTWTLPSLPDIQCCPVEALPSLDPATHVYSFWEGVPPTARAAFGKLVRKSRTVRGVAVVQRAMRSRTGGSGENDGDDEEEAEEPSSSSSSVPEAVMRDYGFGKLALRESFAVSMSGSGRSFRAYVFSREDVSEAESAPSLSLPQAPVAAAADPSGASEQTAIVAASESPESKPRKSPTFGPLPRACPLLAAAALEAERRAKEERKSGNNGNSNGSGWKNITTPTKPSPLSSSRASTPGSVSSSSASTLLFSSSSSLSLGVGGGLCDREARRARRRAGLPAAAPPLPPSLLSCPPPPKQQQQEQASIQSFCRVLRRAGVAGGAGVKGKAAASAVAAATAAAAAAAASPSKGGAAALASSSPSAKVLASPKKAGVTKSKGGGRATAARGLGAALVAATAAAAAK